MLGMSGTTSQMQPNSSSTNNPVQTVSNSLISANNSSHRLAIDEENNLRDISSDEHDGMSDDEADGVAILDRCHNSRFVKHSDCISKSKYRTIHRGYDNESGCEIAWTTYPLHNYQRDRLLRALDEVKALGSENRPNNNILRVYHNEVRTVPTQSSGLSRKHPDRSFFKQSKSVDLPQFVSSASTHGVFHGSLK